MTEQMMKRKVTKLLQFIKTVTGALVKRVSTSYHARGGRWLRRAPCHKGNTTPISSSNSATMIWHRNSNGPYFKIGSQLWCSHSPWYSFTLGLFWHR